MEHNQSSPSIQAIWAAQQAKGATSETAHADLEQTKLYVGLNDGKTKSQKFDTDRYVSVLKRVCIQYNVPFSFDVVNGGYIHENGEYTEENTIVLTFIDVPQETVDEIAKDLCVFFRQESVLVLTSQIQGRMIHEVLGD